MLTIIFFRYEVAFGAILILTFKKHNIQNKSLLSLCRCEHDS